MAASEVRLTKRSAEQKLDGTTSDRYRVRAADFMPDVVVCFYQSADKVLVCGDGGQRGFDTFHRQRFMLLSSSG